MRTIVATALLAAAVLAQEVGQAAPELGDVDWINLGRAKKPKLKSLRGKTVVLVFWASDNMQSTMALPSLQDLHEHYAGLGVRVVTLCRESVDEIEPFLERYDYTIPIGTDMGRATYNRYGLKGWPKAFLIDGKGAIRWKGGPYGVIKEAWKALGVDKEPDVLLTEFVAASKRDRRAALERLRARAPAFFDLKKWAEAVETDPPPAGATVPDLDADRALTGHVDGDPLAIHALKKTATEKFNLRGWARRRHAAAFPLDAKELKRMLKDRRYRTALDALSERARKGSLVGVARRDKGFAAYCAKHREGRVVLARKAIMLHHWTFADKVPTDNEGFWSELSVKSWQEDDDKRMIGVQLGAQMVTKPEMEAFADRCIRQSFIMRGSLPPEAKVVEERERILGELRAKYGP